VRQNGEKLSKNLRENSFQLFWRRNVGETGRFRTRGMRNVRFSSSKDASVRTRQRDMAERDLIFHETFHRDERKHARREVENARWRKETDYFPTHLLAQSKYHKRTKLRGGKNYASTPQRALPKRHESFLHNSPAAKRANDRSVSARGQRRNARKRSSPRSQRSQTRRRTRRFAFCASTKRRQWGGKRTIQERRRRASVTSTRRDRVSSVFSVSSSGHLW